MKKIVFGITSLTLGGAERVLVDLANELVNQYDITIFTIYSNGELEKQLSPKIKLKSLYNKKYMELSKIEKILVPIRVLLCKKSIYKKNIENRYDVEISFLEGPITRLFSNANTNVRKIAWVHNDMIQVFGNGVKASIKKMIDKKTYSKYNTIVFVSKDNLNQFCKEYKIDNKKIVLRNYINSNLIIEKSEIEKNVVDNEKLNFVSVARLVKQKRIDRLIEVHRRLIKEGLKHQIYVIGDGPERTKLKEQIIRYNLENSFHLLGKKENPYPYIKEADYFCLFSEFEGYGMVLEEAKILNKPIIITDTAAREAIEGYNNGTVVENSEKGIYDILKEKIKTGKNMSVHKQVYDNKYILREVIKLIDNQ